MRLAFDREIDRAGDETQCVGLFVKGRRPWTIGCIFQSNARLKQHPLELSATVLVFNHNSDGNILVSGDNDTGFRTKA